MELEKGAWDGFLRAWDNVISAFPDAKRIALHEAGKSILADVQAQVGLRGIRDENFHVRGWQNVRMGSGGGYVAVKPDAVAVTGREATSRQITGYLEKGHGARRPAGKAKRYRPQIKKVGIGAAGNVFVRGRQFYSYARMDADKHAKQAAEKALAELENMLYDLGFDV